MKIQDLVVEDELAKEFSGKLTNIGGLFGWEQMSPYVNSPSFIKLCYNRLIYGRRSAEDGFVKVAIVRGEDGKFDWSEKAKAELKSLADQEVEFTRIDFGNVVLNAFKASTEPKPVVSPTDAEILAMFQSLIDSTYALTNSMWEPYNIPRLDEDDWAKVYVGHVRNLLSGKFVQANEVVLSPPVDPVIGTKPGSAVSGLNPPIWEMKKFGVTAANLPDMKLEVYGLDRVGAIEKYVSELPESDRELWDLKKGKYCGQPFTVTRIYGEIVPGDKTFHLQVEGFGPERFTISGPTEDEALSRYVQGLASGERDVWDVEKKTYMGMPARIFPVTLEN
ncbi:hypothetical protein [Stenotrophomonas sp. GD03657]|uniref:hypothetical protein n=1 Tax=Stenotrophomonas sp. GD03657 TaxID=2975363 RepID=UPI00244A946B|nr:hypothetical protein [Stenotrophomonas sp. GD03657]MDH2154160.1 hypothetical protein [Stenotrophomonas sp. GD03657]